ncbi:hypothetical protein EDD11_000414 [Mortierella claussenii]|nr:hypothetical protein EDD11_000414 [Mortierella claussenii]
MGVPIAFDIWEDEMVRAKLCTTSDCKCPDCGNRRLIRLGSAALHYPQQLQLQQGQDPENRRMPAEYIYTNTPDYRFQQAQVQAHSETGGMHGQATRHGMTTRNAINTSHANHAAGRPRPLVFRGPPLAETLWIVNPLPLPRTDDLSSSEESALSSLSSHSPTVTNVLGLQRYDPQFIPEPIQHGYRQEQDQRHQQQQTLDHRHQYHHGERGSNTPADATRIQEWAIRMEGLDYYHDSDQEHAGNQQARNGSDRSIAVRS